MFVSLKLISAFKILASINLKDFFSVDKGSEKNCSQSPAVYQAHFLKVIAVFRLVIYCLFLSL